MKIMTAKACEALYNKGLHDGYQQARTELFERSDACRRIQADMLLGRPVIAVSNEWCNPVIGFVTKIEEVSKGNNPIPVIHDYIENYEVLSMGVVRFYSDQLFDVMMRLTPFERWAVVTDTHSHFDYTKVKRESILTRYEIQQKLTDNGFFERWRMYKDSGI